MKFEHGFVSTEEPYTQVEGKITIENVDMDSACVLRSFIFFQQVMNIV